MSETTVVTQEVAAPFGSHWNRTAGNPPSAPVSPLRPISFEGLEGLAAKAISNPNVVKTLQVKTVIRLVVFLGMFLYQTNLFLLLLVKIMLPALDLVSS